MADQRKRTLPQHDIYVNLNIYATNLQSASTKRLVPRSLRSRILWFPAALRIYATRLCKRRYPGTNWHFPFRFFQSLKWQCRSRRTEVYRMQIPGSADPEVCYQLPVSDRQRVTCPFDAPWSPFGFPILEMVPRDGSLQLKRAKKY